MHVSIYNRRVQTVGGDVKIHTEIVLGTNNNNHDTRG